MRKYNPNPKHEGIVLKGAKAAAEMVLRPDEAKALLYDSENCFPVPAKRQFVAVKNKNIYVFQNDGSDGYYGYIISGMECCKKYTSVANKVAELLGVNFKRLSRM
jgi:hypothetical protein